jgi:ribokinase
MVTIFGSINADFIFPVAALPTAGQTLLATGMTAEPGGKGANQAVAAARDGARTSMAGAVGNDAMAEIALAGLREAGVDLSFVVTTDQPTGCAAICIDPAGRNQIVVAPGANLAGRQASLPLGPDDIIVTQMETDPDETASLIRRASDAGARTIHNLAPAASLDRAVLARLTLLVVNEDEAAWLADSLGCDPAAQSLSTAIGSTIIRTLGSRGVEWAGALGSGHVPAATVQVVDTTAAGDCFVGVLAAALDRGMALSDAIARANLAAGLACERRGSQRSLPRQSDIDARSS